MLTYGTGTHAEYLEIAMPSFKTFAKRHKYDLLIPDSFNIDRPAPWFKIPALIGALNSYDDVLFLGADTLIVDGRDDIQVPADAWQAMVIHDTNDGAVPNTDVWLVRKPMLPFLQETWRLSQYTHAPWWEQSALLDVMGYNANARPITVDHSTALLEHTHWLDKSWNVHINDTVRIEKQRIQHATMWPDRAAIMREWAKQAEGWINE
jgi:hypothetical protein